ncbi:MAG: site-2 protease family protein [Planctomycetota bacterium]
MDWQAIILLFITLIISLTVHEAAHGFFANLGGDPTAKNAGLVTLNPLPHMQREPTGMVLIPLIVLYMSNGTMCFGGASAPIDPYWAARHPKRAALMSAAGPLANLLLAAIAFAVLEYIKRPDGSNEEAVFDIALSFLLLNLLLAIFNLIPLPPFDGAGVVGGLSRPAQRLYDRFQRIPYSSILALLIAWQLIPYLFFPAFREVCSWLTYPPSFR